MHFIVSKICLNSEKLRLKKGNKHNYGILLLGNHYENKNKIYNSNL